MRGQGGPIGDILRLVREDIITYRQGMREDNPMLSLDAVRAWNALFPSNRLPNSNFREYGIVESTELYNKETYESNTIECPNRKNNDICTKPTEFDDEQISHRTITIHEMGAGGNYSKRYVVWDGKQMPVWECPNCLERYDMCDLDGNQVLHVKKLENIQPRYIRVVPHPPDQNDFPGVDGLRAWRAAMRPWLHNYFIILHSETTRYRNDKLATGELILDGVDDEYNNE